MLSDFLNLFYPSLCKACGKPLLKNEQVICTHCHYHLPHTGYHTSPDNPVYKLFWGRTNILFAAAFLHFRKGGRVQQLLHQLKYNNCPEIGERLGQLYAFQLERQSCFAPIDVIIPVPLHKNKEKLRGYNQSELFASGLATGLGREVNTVSLLRETATETQTKKSRFARYLNTKEVFAVHEPGKIAGKHVLLVDDVVTTGSTLEACVNVLNRDNLCKVSVATIAAAL